MPPRRRATTKKEQAAAEPPVEDEALKPTQQDHAATVNSTAVEPVIMQLPIPPSRLDEIMENTSMNGILEYNPTITDPQPYIPQDAFACQNDMLVEVAQDGHTKRCIKTEDAVDDSEHADEVQKEGGTCKATACYWCCHDIPHIEYGMPIQHDVVHKSFTLFGSFCSLECAAAYNFSTYMGSNRVWEIHSWIQLLGHRYGYKGQIRPAPSRYLLKMFNGPLTIEEFRAAHKGQARTYIMNIPPFIQAMSQMESLNTSFLEGGAPDKKTRTKKVAAAP
jgi:hypothetical protein